MPGVCLIIPCFNEAARLPVQAFTTWLTDRSSYAVCFVDDGSTDNTADVLARLRATSPERVEIVTLGRNRGKAEAVRSGVLHVLSRGRFDYVGYWDADLATPLAELTRFVDLLQREPTCEFALGSRVKRLGADIERSPARHVIGRVFATVASLVLDLPVYDSQCGAKLFRASTAAQLFADAFISQWLFDVELLARMNQLRPIVAHGSAIEIPLGQWRDVTDSKLRLQSIAVIPVDLLRIGFHYAGRRRRGD